MEILNTQLNNSEMQALKSRADSLKLEIPQFQAFLSSTNRAYDSFLINGPFYGRGAAKVTPPTFRIAAEPVLIPSSLRDSTKQFGQDVLALSQALTKLPDKYKYLIGEGVDYSIPISWRVDAILTSENQLKVNEIQVADGADALMVGEQLAYGLQTLEQSTASVLADSLLKIDRPRVICLRDSLSGPYATNTLRMAEFLDQVSESRVKLDLVERADISKTNWLDVDGIFNNDYVRLEVLAQSGVPIEKIISAGPFSVLESKAVFALLGEASLEDFWSQKLGLDRLMRIRNMIIDTKFVQTSNQLNRIRSVGDVAKAYWINGEFEMLDRGQTVFGLWSNPEEWETAISLLNKGSRFITQPFIAPKSIQAFLRAKGGKTLEKVQWFNRICLKYVVDGDPNCPDTEVKLTAMEATLGSSMKPAGRDCCFTAATF